MELNHSKPVIMITGANGLLGRLCYQTLKHSYQIVLVDKGFISSMDETSHYTRFHHEHLNHIAEYLTQVNLELPDDVHCVDIISDLPQLHEIVQKFQPVLIIHMANILETQPIELIKTNDIINHSVLQLGRQYQIPCLCASSIMMYFGTYAQIYPPQRRILTCDPSANTLDNLRFHYHDQNDLDHNYTYVKTKELLESNAQQLCVDSPNLTMITLRLGWVEAKPIPVDPQHFNASIILEHNDLSTFILALVNKTLNHSLMGYHCYTAISEHPSRWISLKRETEELNWSPHGYKGDDN